MGDDGIMITIRLDGPDAPTTGFGPTVDLGAWAREHPDEAAEIFGRGVAERMARPLLIDPGRVFEYSFTDEDGSDG